MMVDKEKDICRYGEDERLARLIAIFQQIFKYAILLAVIMMLGLALSTFLLGAGYSVVKTYSIWMEFITEQRFSAKSLVSLLEIVSDLLKAVIFYIIALGLFNIFIYPLPLCDRLRLREIHDLEGQIIGIVIVILAIEFLERFIRIPDSQSLHVLWFGLGLAAAVTALVAAYFFMIRACRLPREKGE
ncbi:YqhA family protein [Desulfocurvibacter africanus]|uniref:YqhA family protein n=1 Tax=Desulfocurvibacter africanus TaxID=873 RepID=UPI000683D71E|nr:YqhA family protein [Desulfocurvibacter africanus]